jgi:hypothetical protein
MKWDGIDVKLSKTYGWRPGDPTTDRDSHGAPVEHNYITLVKIEDCPVTTDETGKRFYDPKGVKQAVTLSHGGTNYGYGKTRVHTGNRTAMTERGLITVARWYTTPMYVVLDGQVYVGTVKTIYKPASVADAN